MHKPHNLHYGSIRNKQDCYKRQPRNSSLSGFSKLNRIPSWGISYIIDSVSDWWMGRYMGLVYVFGGTFREEIFEGGRKITKEFMIIFRLGGKKTKFSDLKQKEMPFKIYTSGGKQVKVFSLLLPSGAHKSLLFIFPRTSFKSNE